MFDPPLKITHLVSHPTLNGVATSTKALIDAQIRVGHEVMLVHPHNSWIEKQQFAGPITLLESTFKIHPKGVKATGYPIREWGRTLCHSHGSRANKLLMVFRIADGVPSVMTAHARLFQIPWMFAHAVVGLSQQTMNYYASRFLVPRRRLYNVPNMFDVDTASPVAAEARLAARQALGIRPETFLLGSVGAIGWRKRQTDMVMILRDMLKQGRDAELLLIGGDTAEPDFTKSLHEVLADPVVSKRVHLAGYRTDATDLLPAVDLFLCTSGVEEAPIAPLEAMARSIPVLSTDVGNMADLMQKDLLFPIGDVAAMARVASELMDDPERRAQAGETARRTVAQKLSPDVIIPQIDAIYHAAIARASDRGKKSTSRDARLHKTPAE